MSDDLGVRTMIEQADAHVMKFRANAVTAAQIASVFAPRIKDPVWTQAQIVAYSYADRFGMIWG